MCQWLSANTSTHNLLGAGAKPFSVNSESTSINTAVSSSWLSLPIDKKSSCQVTLQEKWLFGCLWCRSRIRAHNKLWGKIALGPVSAHLSLYSSSSHLDCKLKSTTWVWTSQVSLSLIAHMKQQSLQLALMEWKLERMARKAQAPP